MSRYRRIQKRGGHNITEGMGSGGWGLTLAMMAERAVAVASWMDSWKTVKLKMLSGAACMRQQLDAD